MLIDVGWATILSHIRQKLSDVVGRALVAHVEDLTPSLDSRVPVDAGSYLPRIKHEVVMFTAFVAGVYTGDRLFDWLAPAFSRSVRNSVSRTTRRLVTRLLSSGRIEATFNKSLISTIPFVASSPSNHHTHTLSAGDRHRANQWCGVLAASMGYDLSHTQVSASLQRVVEASGQDHATAGSRTWYWPKDATTRYAPERRAPFEAIIDVDYYLDMPEHLATHPRVVAMYTIVPEEVAGSSGEGHFTFLPSGEIDYRVVGGGRYTHHLWDWSRDNVMVTARFAGVPYRTVNYAVEMRRVSAHRAVVVLVPLACHGIATAWLADMFLKSTPLTRLNVVQAIHDKDKNDTTYYSRLSVVRPDGVYLSTGVCGKYHCVTVPEFVDSAIENAANTGANNLNPATVTSHIDSFVDKSSAKAMGLILTRFHRRKQVAPTPFTALSSATAKNFTFNVQSYDADAKPLVVPFMNPLDPNGYSPLRDRPTEQRSIRGRVTEFQKNYRTAQAEPVVAQYATEFIALLFPERGVLAPCSYDVVEERQNRPSQRILLDEAFHSAKSMGLGIKAFSKAEGLTKPSDVRNISVIEPYDKAEWSSYMYPLYDYLCQFGWFAPGLTPRAVAERVAAVAGVAAFIVNEDENRMDGHVDITCREFEDILMHRAFDAIYHDAMERTQATQFCQRGYTTLGVKYESGYSRASGSPETTVFNTLLSAFKTYIAWRIEGVVPGVAFARLGVYGGDDGLSPDVPVLTLIKAAELIGQDLDAELIQRGERGVTFLSRLYSPDVWWGDTSSMADPRRLAKLHLTTPLPSNITPIDKLEQKLAGILLSDRDSPVYGDLARSYYNSTGRPVPTSDPHLLRPYYTRYDGDEQYPNCYGEWMHYEWALLQPEFDWRLFQAGLEFAENTHDPLAYLCLPPCIPDHRMRHKTENIVVSGENVDADKPVSPDGKERQRVLDEYADVSGEEIEAVVCLAPTPNGRGCGKPVAPGHEHCFWHHKRLAQTGKSNPAGTTARKPTKAPKRATKPNRRR